MSFDADNLKLESLYLNKISTTQIDESVPEQLKAMVDEGIGIGKSLKYIGIGAIIGILTHLTTFSTGRGVARYVHPSSETHKDVREGINTIIHMSQCIIDCMNKRASEESPVSQLDIQKLRDVQFLYSEIKSNTQNISSEDVERTIEQLKDVVYANGLEDEPRIHRWIGTPEAYSDPHIVR